jgi:hypothetical protein
MFRYTLDLEIRGHSRERSGFAAIRVEIFGQPTGSRVSNGGTLACSATLTFARFAAIRGSAADLRPFAAICVEIFGQPTGSQVSNGGTLACSATLWIWRFAAIRGSAADLRPFALGSLASRLVRGCRTGEH